MQAYFFYEIIKNEESKTPQSNSVLNKGMGTIECYQNY